MTGKDIELAKQLALSIISDFPKPIIDDPEIALAAINWPNPPTSPEQISHHQSINFMDGAWLSRLALAGAYLEKHFPEHQIQAAEVLDNPYLQPVLIEFKSNPSLDLFNKIQILEKPYFTIIIEGKIFDLFGFSFGQNIIHTKVNPLPFWPAVATFREIQLINQKKLSNAWHALDSIEKICPGSIIVVEEKIGQLFAQKNTDVIANHLSKFTEARPTITGLYIMYLFTGNSALQKQISDRYSDKIFKYISQHLLS